MADNGTVFSDSLTGPESRLAASGRVGVGEFVKGVVPVEGIDGKDVFAMPGNGGGVPGAAEAATVGGAQGPLEGAGGAAGPAFEPSGAGGRGGADGSAWAESAGLEFPIPAMSMVSADDNPCSASVVKLDTAVVVSEGSGPS